MIPFSLALDDTDSPSGGCTTHLAGLLLALLAREDRILLSDYPLLVRLAPGVPFKTRGNAAVVIRGYLLRGDLAELAAIAYNLAASYGDYPWGPLKEPGIALYPGVDPWREPRLRSLYLEAVSGLIHSSRAESAARKAGVRLLGGRGRIGAAASLAALAPGDPYTFELIAYRRPEMIGTERCIRDDPLFEAGLPPCTFNNVDITTGRTVAAPHGPDPVLAGFRGTCVDALGCYSRLLCEEPHFWVLYRSNQHTDIHYSRGPARPYQSLRATLTLTESPRRIAGGHVLARTREGIVVAAYRESGPIRELLSRLTPGDRVTIGGTVKPRMGEHTLGAEKLFAAYLGPREIAVNPRCPRCGHRMKSLGRQSGFKCPKCGYRDPSASKIRIRLVPPAVGPASPPPGRIGHLVRPYNLYRLPRWEPPDRGVEPGEVLSYSSRPPVSTMLACPQYGGKS